jgi:5'-nucleotidase
MPDQPRILVSNDDGYRSEGLATLVAVLEDLAEIWVVAPESEQSATSHAITIHRPLRLKEVEGKPRWYAVDGTPTDCAWLGINHVLRDRRPQLLVSGINHGPNLADDVFYSGTVAAAREAAIIGVPSVAVSLAARRAFEFGPAARFARALVERALAEPLPPNMHLNVNVPPGIVPEEWIASRQGKHSYGADVVEKTDPRGRKYYWIGGNEYQHEDIPGSDCNAVLREGRVAVTALTLDSTDYPQRKQLGEWNLKGFRRHDP